MRDVLVLGLAMTLGIGMLWAGDSTPVPGLTISTPTARAISLRPVATVNGEPITLGDLELALLRTEGVALIKERCEQVTDAQDWAALRDDQPVLGWNPTRGQVVLELLTSKGGDVRKELVDIKLVEQAMIADGQRLDQRAIDEEVARIQKRLDASMERRGSSRTPNGLRPRRWRCRSMAN